LGYLPQGLVYLAQAAQFSIRLPCLKEALRHFEKDPRPPHFLFWSEAAEMTAWRPAQSVPFA